MLAAAILYGVTTAWWSFTIPTMNAVQQNYYESSLPLQSLATNKSNSSPPLIVVSFIIPTTLHRSTLPRTLESLRNQTNPHWEAIVGIDTVVMMQERSPPIHSIIINDNDNDPRIRYVNVTTTSTDRGKNANGAGDIRNQILMMQLATGTRHANTSTTTTTTSAAQWIAFVDDDDTVSPYYVEYLAQISSQQSSSSSSASTSIPDIVLFRMQDVRPAKQFWYHGILPPLAHGPVASVAAVGISFAVRRQFWMDEDTAAAANAVPLLLRFRPGPAEDFDFLYRAQHDHGAVMSMSCCVAYYVRSAPPPLWHTLPQQQQHCTIQPALVLHQDLRKIRTLDAILNLPSTRQWWVNQTAITATAIHKFRSCVKERPTKHARWLWGPFT